MTTAHAFWQKLGLWVWMPERIDPHWLGATLREAGFRWVTIQIHNGLGVRPETKAALDAGWAQKVKSHGLEVGGWGVLIDAPEREANLASQLCYRWLLTHYIADAEGPHKGDWQGEIGDKLVKGDQGRSDIFVRHFRNLRTQMPLGLSTYGAAFAPNVLGHTADNDRGPMHFRCWLLAGARLMPQAYPNDPEVGPVGEPNVVVDHAKRAGWPLSLMHMTIGHYNGWGAKEYIPRLRACRAASNGVLRGFSVYTAETMVGDEYVAIGREAAKYGLVTL